MEKRPLKLRLTYELEFMLKYWTYVPVLGGDFEDHFWYWHDRIRDDEVRDAFDAFANEDIPDDVSLWLACAQFVHLSGEVGDSDDLLLEAKRYNDAEIEMCDRMSSERYNDDNL